jgi:hypothetical protein
VRGLLVILVVGYLSACKSGSTTSVSDLMAGLGITFKATEGLDQTTIPKYEVELPITFLVSDANGKPVPNLAVEFRLLDVTGRVDITHEEILAALESNTRYISADGESLTTKTDAELLGSILRQDNKTNDKGEASVKLLSPHMFERSVAVVGYMQDGLSASALGYAVFHTSALGGAGSGFQITTSKSLKEIAGEDFEINITAMKDGIIQALEGEREVSFFTDVPSHFLDDKTPQGAVTCLFSGGRCRVPGGPWYLRGAGLVPISVLDITNEIQPGSAIIEVEEGEAFTVILSEIDPATGSIRNACGRLNLAPDDLVNPCITFSADTDVTSYWPVVVDRGGNFLYAPATTWSVTGPLGGNTIGQPDGIDAASVAGIQRVYPYTGGLEIGKGRFTVSTADFTATYSYRVLPGAPVAVDVSSEHFGFEITTRPFRARVTLRDRKNNICDNHVRPEAFNFTLTGATMAPDAVTNPVSSLNETLIFNNGTALTTNTLHVVDKTDVVHIQATSTVGSGATSTALSMSPGPSYLVKIRRAAAGGGTEFTAPLAMTTTDTATFFSAGYDQYHNYTQDILSNFSANGILSAALSATTGTNTTVIPTSGGVDQLIVSPTVLGGANPTTPIPPVTSPNIEITSAEAVRFEITTTNGLVETAGEPFDIMLSAKDNQFLTAATYTGMRTLHITNIGPTSWTGQQPTLPSGTAVQCNFNAGNCTLNPTPHPGWRCTDADNDILFSVQDVTGDGSQVPGVWTVFINCEAGAADRIVFANQPGGRATGAVPYVHGHLVHINADQTFDFAPATVDKAGNFLENTVSPNVTGTATLISPYISVQGGGSFRYDPVLVVVPADGGTITTNHSTISNQGLLNVRVDHGMPTTINYEFPSGTTVTAGECYEWNALITDNDGNTATSFNSYLSLGLGIKNANTSFVDVNANSSYIGNWSYPSGDRKRFVTAFYQFNSAASRWDPIWHTNDAEFSTAPFDYMSGGTKFFGRRSIAISNGELVHGSRICIGDATDVAPIVEISIPSTEIPGYGILPILRNESPQLTVVEGAETYIQFTNSSGGWYCNPVGQINSGSTTNIFQLHVQYGSASCAHRSADSLTQTIRARIMDSAGNFLREGNGTWTKSLQHGMSITSELTDRITFNATARGVYQLTFNDTTSSISNGMRLYVYAGDPVDFTINTVSQSGGAVRTTEPFTVYLQLVDAHNNPKYNLTGTNSGYEYGDLSSTTRNITFNFNGTDVPGPAPNSTASQIGTNVNGFNFRPSGSYWSGNTFRLANSDATAVLTATVSGLATSTQTLSITPQAGAVTEVKLVNGTTINDEIIDTVTLDVASSHTWYSLGYDTEGNVTGIVDASFTPSGVLVGMTNKTGTGRVQVIPNVAGDGNLLVDPVPVGLANYATTAITVGEGDLHRFNLSFPTAPGSVFVAGQTHEVQVVAVDSQNNTISSFTGSKTLTWSAISSTPNPEERSMILPVSGTFEFTNGVADATAALNVTAYNASNTPILQVTHIDATVGLVSGTRILTVNRGAFDHYGTTVTTTYYPRSNRSNFFTATAFWRDAAGNNLTTGGPNLPVTLTIVRSDGTAANGTLSGTTSLNLFANNGAVLVSNLAYDAAGYYKIYASDGTTNSSLISTQTIYMVPTIDTVGQYVINFNNGANYTRPAWQCMVMTVRAADNYGNTLTNVDTQLNGLAYTWSGANPGPRGQQPRYHATGTTAAFVSGLATDNCALFAAIQVMTAGQLTLQDNRSPARGGSNTNTLTIVAGNLNRYEITSTETTRTADSTASGRFSLTVQAYDPVYNPVPGESNINIATIYKSGTATNTSIIKGNSGTSAEVTGLNMSANSNPVTINDLYYEVGNQEIEFNVTGGSFQVPPGIRITMSFTPTIATVKSYDISGSAGPNTVGPNNINFTVTTRDIAANAITGIDADLNSQSYSWSGFSASPNSTPVGWGSLSTFNSGVATVTHSVYNSSFRAINAITITDNYAPGNRTGRNINSITMAAAAASNMATNFSGTKTAGTSFTGTATITDTYGNNTSVGCGALVVDDAGGGINDSPGGHGGAATSPIYNGAGSQGSVGVYTTGNITLFKSGVQNIRLTACGIGPQNVAITVNPAATGPNGIYLSTTSYTLSNDAAVNAGVSSHLAEVKCNDTNATGTDAGISCAPIYAYFWDAYGNRVDPTVSQCAWSMTNNGSGSLPATSGSSHARTVTHSSFLDGNLVCTKDGRSQSVLLFGGLSEFEMDHDYTAPVQAANANINISELRLFYSKNGVKTPKDDAAVETVSMSTTSSRTIVQLGHAATQTMTFNASGVYSTNLPFNFIATENSRSLTLNIRGRTQVINSITINPGPASSLTVTSPTTQTAGTAFTLTAEARDSFGNLSDNGCTSITVNDNGGGINDSPGGHGGSVTSATYPAPSAQGSMGIFTTGNISLYKSGNNTIRISACGIGPQNQVINVNPALTGPNGIYLSTTSYTLSDTATINASVNAHLDELLCADTNATGTDANVGCAPVYAYFWDAYGNRVDTAASSCAWSMNNLGSGSIPAVSGTSHARTINHTSFLDSELVCTKDGQNKSVLMYGGLSDFEMDHDYATSVVAGNDNINITQMRLFMSKNGVRIGKSNAGAETVQMSTTSVRTIVQLGHAASQSLTFNGSGEYTTNLAYDFTTVEADKNLTLTVRGRTQTISAINVTPAPVSTLTLTAPGNQIAGNGFTLSVQARDAFNNLSANGCGNITINDAGGGVNDSPGGHGGAVFSAIYPAASAQTSTGVYNTGGLTLYKAGSNVIRLTACGIGPQNETITVEPTSTVNSNGIYLSTSSNYASPPSAHTTEIQCSNTTATNSVSNAVSCPTLYAYFWDAYGNILPNASTCAWSTLNYAGAASATGTTQTHTLSHSNFVDTVLTCTRNGHTRSIDLYGGQSEMEISTDYATTEVAALDNINITNISVFTSKQGVKTARNDVTNETVGLSTNSTLGIVALGQAASQNLAFSGTGQYTTAIPFDFTRTESSRSLTVSVRGQSAIINDINITPATVDSLEVPALTAKEVGETFTVTAYARDQFNNLTEVGCAANLLVSGTGGNATLQAPNGTGATLPAAAAFTPYGTFTTGNIGLVKVGSNSLDFNACGLAAVTRTLNVTTDATANYVALHTTNSDPGYNGGLTELLCSDGAGSNVSCDALYAYVYDTYGNPINAGSETCTWSYTSIGEAPTPTVSGTAQSFTLSHTDFIDGNLICTKGAASASINTYGGVSSIAVSPDTGGTISAGLDNLTVTALEIRMQKNGATIAKTNAGASADIAIATTSSLGAAGLGQSNPFSCALTAGACSASIPFDFTAAETGVSLTLSYRGKSDSITGINVDPGAATQINVTPTTTTPDAGDSFTATVNVMDAYNNPTNVGCGNLVVTENAGVGSLTSSGDAGQTAQAAGLPADAAMSGTLGEYVTANTTLYKAGSNVLRYTACGINTTQTFTVGESNVNVIYLKASNAGEPGIPGAADASTTCTGTSTLSCDTVYAYGWDQWGNNIDGTSFACGSWSYIDSNGAPYSASPPSLSNTASAHSTQLSTSDYHIQGNIRCTVGSVTGDISAGLTAIQKTYGYTCGSWSCSSTNPTATCTVNNASGYNIASFSFGGNNAQTTLDTTDCDAGLNTGSTCNVVVTGTYGSASGSLSVSATASAPTFVNFSHPSATPVQTGANAPNCTDEISYAITTDWAAHGCVSGAARFTATLTNDHSFNSITWGDGTNLVPGGGATLVSSTCQNTTTAPAATCEAVVSQATPGATSTLALSPTDGFFQTVNISKASAPNCTQNASVAAATDIACVANEKQATFTITNNNAFESMTFPGGAVTANGTNATIAADNCSSETLAPSQSCTVSINWNAAPAVSDTNITITESGAYFNNVTIGAGDYDNSCP